ncbi:MAG: desulfoferrodoxin [bacterium]|nr:desulfoferrodoxin [bacterium]
MTKLREVYKCGECGNIVEVAHAAGGKLICCGQDMTLLQENSVDAALEKHVPVIEKSGSVVTVKVGSVAHPMEENHYIEFIELHTASRVYHAHLKPGKTAEASFDINADVRYARAYCNLHGLWKN